MTYVLYPDKRALWHRRVLVYMVNWVAWFLPAAVDAIADDVGDTYQRQVTFLVVFAIVLGVALPIVLGVTGGLTWPMCVLFGITAYLAVGILYRFNNRQWGGWIQ